MINSDLTYKKLASDVPISTQYTIPSEYKVAILIARIIRSRCET